MTREEAKGNLIHAIRWNDIPKKEALDMAIKALEQESCEDAISRRAVLDLCDSTDPEYKVVHFKEDVECLPSVILQPKIGRWIEHEIKDTCRWLTCSVCGYEWVNKKENFCPNCGSKM